MKNLFKSCVLALMLFSSQTIGCPECSNIAHYVGIEYDSSFSIKNHGSVFGNGRHSPFYHGGISVAGIRFKNFGIEAGYHVSDKKVRTLYNLASVISPSTGQPGTLHASLKNRFQGYHFDVLGYFPILEDFDLIGSIGYGRLCPKFRMQYTVICGEPKIIDVMNDDIRNRFRPVFRFGTGIEWKVAETLSFRGMVRFKRLSHKHHNEITSLALHGSTHSRSMASASIGALIKF